MIITDFTVMNSRFPKTPSVNLSCVVVLQKLANKCTKMNIVGVDTQPPSSVHCLRSPIFHARTSASITHRIMAEQLIVSKELWPQILQKRRRIINMTSNIVLIRSVRHVYLHVSRIPENENAYFVISRLRFKTLYLPGFLMLTYWCLTGNASLFISS